MLDKFLSIERHYLNLSFFFRKIDHTYRVGVAECWIIKCLEEDLQDHSRQENLHQKGDLPVKEDIVVRQVMENHQWLMSGQLNNHHITSSMTSYTPTCWKQSWKLLCNAQLNLNNFRIVCNNSNRSETNKKHNK